MNRSLVSIGALAGALALIPLTSAAQSAGTWSPLTESGRAYLGAHVGMGRISADCSGLQDCDRDHTGYKVVAGYRLSPDWALEIRYTDWGRAHASLAVTDAVATSELKARSGGLGAAYFIPLTDNWHAQARFGLAYNRGRAGAEVQTGGITTSAYQTHSQFYPYVGLGVSVKLAPRWTLDGQLDATRVKFSFDDGTTTASDRYSAHLLSLGLSYAF